VPWSLVLPLAVVLSFANGFWMVTLRGAPGSIERTSAPFASWLRESTALLRARQRDRARSRYRHAVALVAVLTATTVGVGCSSLPVVNLFPSIGSGYHAELGEAVGSPR
jgi:hypothetical protein